VVGILMEDPVSRDPVEKSLRWGSCGVVPVVGILWGNSWEYLVRRIELEFPSLSPLPPISMYIVLAQDPVTLISLDMGIQRQETPLHVHKIHLGTASAKLLYTAPEPISTSFTATAHHRTTSPKKQSIIAESAH
jgi:hypothetical protein